jgi:hypothetical protein
MVNTSTSLASKLITADFQKVDVHVVAGLIKSFVKELPEPLIPYEIYDNLANIRSSVVRNSVNLFRQGRRLR